MPLIHVIKGIGNLFISKQQLCQGCSQRATGVAAQLEAGQTLGRQYRSAAWPAAETSWLHHSSLLLQ